MHDLSTTVVAVATPPGRGGIGCLRVSGEQAGEVALRLFHPASPRRGPEPGGRPCFGRFVGRDGRPLDHGFLVLFGAKASYTGAAARGYPTPTIRQKLRQGRYLL